MAGACQQSDAGAFFHLIMHFGATLCNSRADTSPDKERDDISNFGALGSGE